jgi:hypothetical protein
LKNLNHLKGYLSIKGLGNVIEEQEAQNAELKKKTQLRHLELDFYVGIEENRRVENLLYKLKGQAERRFFASSKHCHIRNPCNHRSTGHLSSIKFSFLPLHNYSDKPDRFSRKNSSAPGGNVSFFLFHNFPIKSFFLFYFFLFMLIRILSSFRLPHFSSCCNG